MTSFVRPGSALSAGSVSNSLLSVSCASSLMSSASHRSLPTAVKLVTSCSVTSLSESICRMNS